MKISKLLSVFWLVLGFFLSASQVYAGEKDRLGHTVKNKNVLKIIKTSICFGSSYEQFEKRTSQYDVSINKYAAKYGVSVALIKSVITAESCFNPDAVSPKGAQGLMQLIPATAKRFGVTDSFDPDQNIRGGTRYIKFLLKYFDDDLINAIVAYNSGEGTVKKYDGIPPYKETREYVSKVSTLYRFYANNGIKEKKKRYKEFKKGNHPPTFFIPRAMPKSRLTPYKNYSKSTHGLCTNRTSTRLKRSTWLIGGKGLWQRFYIANKGDTLRIVQAKTGVRKKKIMQMNGFGSRVRLKSHMKVLVWECRN